MRRIVSLLACLCAAIMSNACLAQENNQAPPGFTAIFDGSSLDGWHWLVENPTRRADMSEQELAEKRAASAEVGLKHWRVADGQIINDGHGPHLCTDAMYGDFELYIDWKISEGADSGIYLRGTPQVQIWDPVNGIDQARVGSGGLYNNQHGLRTPAYVADKPAGEWNRFRILMIGSYVTVELNGHRIVDRVPMENYWDRSRPLPAREQIELQTHGGEIRFRNIFIRSIAAEEANAWLASHDAALDTPLFNGRDLSGWVGSTNGYFVEDGALVCDPSKGGNLFTESTYDDFLLRFEFLVTPGGNNGIAIRAPLEGNPAYQGMEIQVLDDTAPQYAQLQPFQYHGSVYGVGPCHRGYQRPVGQWNYQEIECRGSRVTVRLNGVTITDVDLAEIDTPMDGADHPGLLRTGGHIGFMGHGHAVRFRNLRVRTLD